MAFLGSKASHELCSVRIQTYLEKDGRALARDFLNLPGEDMQRAWSYFMDKTRASSGNDEPWHGKRAVTYQHFIISPDPRDGVSLDDLRALATDWAKEFFGHGVLNAGKLGTYEVAIIYHNDNNNKIPHAHVIVNNTDLDTGCRLQINRRSSKELTDRLQELAEQRGLSTYDGDVFPEQERSRYYTKAERAMKRGGRFVWKDDLANKIEIATRTTTSMEGFKKELAGLAVGLEERDGDFFYRHPSNPDRWKVTGYRLGKSYTPEGIERNITLAKTERLARSEQLRRNVTKHVMADFLESMDLVAVVEHSKTTDDVARALRIRDRYDLRSVSDFKAQASALERKAASFSEGSDKAVYYKAEADRVADALEVVQEANFFEGVELAPKPSRRGSGGGRSGKPGTEAGRRGGVADRSTGKQRKANRARSGQSHGGKSGGRRLPPRGRGR